MSTTSDFIDKIKYFSGTLPSLFNTSTCIGGLGSSLTSEPIREYIEETEVIPKKENLILKDFIRVLKSIFKKGE